MNYTIKAIPVQYLRLKLILLCACMAISVIGVGQATYDVFNYGAKGDGVTLDTKAIQAAIDQCHGDGGGRVLLYKGVFRSGTIYLKSNVTLYVEAGAILRASDNLEDFPITASKYKSIEGTYVTNKMLIYAEAAQNISITGQGTIDGNGDHWVDGPYGRPTFSLRPRIIHFRGSENITIRDITLYNSASWVQSYQSCKNILIHGITVDSRANKDIEKSRTADAPIRNNDGIDLIDCQQVRIANCYINSEDDGICLKSFSHVNATRDVVITNCVISTNANGIKIGTETAGAFEDIVINNCVIYDTRSEGIAFVTTDGARIDRVMVSNISMRNIKGAAIAVRLGIRNRTYHDSTTLNSPHIRNVVFDNIQGTRISTDYGCNITGIASIPVEGITLRNINLKFEGGGTREDSFRDIPEQEKSYPSGRTFGRIPAYGLFLRHARNITLDNVQFSFDKAEDRPAVIADNVHGLEIKGLKAQATAQMPELIRLTNSKEVFITQSRSIGENPTFLSINGDKSANIVLRHNVMLETKQSIKYENPNLKKTVKEIDK